MLRAKPHRLRVVSHALVRARRRRRAVEPPPGRDALEGLRRLLPAEAESRLVGVPAGRPPWTGTGLELKAGDEVTTFVTGRVHYLRLLDVWAAPGQQLWFRNGEAGPVFRGTRDTHTFTAADGPLDLASHPPGAWTDPAGGHSRARGELRASGGLHVLVVRWPRGADSGAALRAIADADPSGLAGAELERRETFVPEPPGWAPLWDVGASEIYRAADGAIECDTHRDVGIVRRPADLPLTEATRLRWSWRVDELPSELAEDTLPTHDYLSIALEFDNGHDLTWHWSAELPPEWSYRCPIPSWRHRETHMVVRRGQADLGRWVTEERAVRRDYAAAVGPPPDRIVAVWLIAVSVFQRGRGRCAYGDIELRDGERVERVQQV